MRYWWAAATVGARGAENWVTDVPMASAIPASATTLTSTANGSADIQARSCSVGFGL